MYNYSLYIHESPIEIQYLLWPGSPGRDGSRKKKVSLRNIYGNELHHKIKHMKTIKTDTKNISRQQPTQNIQRSKAKMLERLAANNEPWLKAAIWTFSMGSSSHPQRFYFSTKCSVPPLIGAISKYSKRRVLIRLVTERIKMWLIVFPQISVEACQIWKHR